MPTYEYLCKKCGQTFEVFQSMKDAPLKVCTCGKKGRVKRLLGAGAGVIFKGSGFYETDYKRPAPKPEAPKKTESTAKPESSAATAKPSSESTSAKK